MQQAWRGSPNYPKRLDALGASAPKQVFFRGPAWSPEPTAVAIVGSRRASEGGRVFAEALARLLGTHEVAVVSGGALGIDGAAHRGALESGARTCVVLPTPVSAPAPPSHGPLFEAIIQAGGTLLSEYEMRLGRHTFAERNRLIAALSDIVVIIEARARSGTRHTADAARGLERPLLCVGWSPRDPRGEGARALTAEGAQRIDAPEDVLAVLRSDESPPKTSPLSLGDGQPAPESPLMRALTHPQTLESLAATLGVDPEPLTVQLLEEELSGRVERAGGRWRRVPSPR